MIGWTIGVVGYNGNQVLVKVTHPSIVPTLGGIALELPWDLDEDLAFKPISKNNDVYGWVPHVFDLNSRGGHSIVKLKTISEQSLLPLYYML